MRLFQRKTDAQLTPHFRLREFLQSPGFPDLAYYKPTAIELRNIKTLATQVLEPLRLTYNIPVIITGSMRPNSLRSKDGQTFYDYLKAKGYHPAENSDHALFAGTDFRFAKGASKDVYLDAFRRLQADPDVRQVILYLETDPKTHQPYVDHIHVSVVVPGLGKLGPENYAFTLLDGKRLESELFA